MTPIEKVITEAQACIGTVKGDARHHQIIDGYNTIRPLPRGYKVTYGDNWCAAFVSEIARRCGYLDIMPPECGVSEMRAKYNALGRYRAKAAYKPQRGDIVFYTVSHVGIVYEVTSSGIIAIEGNHINGGISMCEYVSRPFSAILGYGIPDYASKQTSTPSAPTYPYKAKVVVDPGETLNIRHEPSMTAQIDGVMPPGAIVTVTGEKDGWAEITIKAYAGSQYLKRI